MSSPQFSMSARCNVCGQTWGHHSASPPHGIPVGKNYTPCTGFMPTEPGESLERAGMRRMRERAAALTEYYGCGRKVFTQLAEKIRALEIDDDDAG